VTVTAPSDGRAPWCRRLRRDHRDRCRVVLHDRRDDGRRRRAAVTTGGTGGVEAWTPATASIVVASVVALSVRHRADGVAVAVAGVEHVVAGAAVEQVPAARCERVVAGATAQVVVAGAAVDRVGAVAAGQDVVTVAAVEGQALGQQRGEPAEPVARSLPPRPLTCTCSIVVLSILKFPAVAPLSEIRSNWTPGTVPARSNSSSPVGELT
jgi:hypothetical protein